MTDRRAELEKKKLKLQQLRELKEQRRNDKFRDKDLISDLGLSLASPSSSNHSKMTSSTITSTMSTANSDNVIKDVDDLLESVGIITNKSGNATNHTVQLPGQQMFDSTCTIEDGSVGNSSSLSLSTSSTNTYTTTNNDINQQQNKTSGQRQTLTLTSFPPVSIAPKEQVTYEKQTQTSGTGTNSNNSSTTNDRGGPLDYYEWDDEFHVLTYDDLGNEEDGDSGNSGLFNSGGPHGHHQHQQSQHGGHHQQVQHGQSGPGANHKLNKSSLPTVEMVRPATTPQDLSHCHQSSETQANIDPQMVNNVSATEKKQKKRLEYTEEERRHLMQTDSFRKFLDRAVRITERTLSCPNSRDIFVDYTGQVECMDNEDLKSGQRLSLNTTFMDDRWSKGRIVTNFDWCSQFPELLVASYYQNDHAPNEPDGICLVWNMKFKKNTPEYVFHCQSPVMSACFAKFHPNLILGGTYSGQIVLWDNRSGKRVPVQRSPLSASVHTHPVYCLKVVGTPNSHNLISISNDGKLCSWSLDMLSHPQETMELCQQSRSIAAMSMSFPVADYNNFILGSQEGSVYSACRHGAKAGITDVFEGHQGPVTAVDFHQAQSTQIDFSHLFLTSSFDWTFKLWSMRDTSSSKLLYSFEDGNDYIYDVRWSPIHPALFATVDGLGKLDLWNLNQDTELPTLSTNVESNCALNCLIWSPNGQQIVVGDDNGKINVYDVSEQLAFPKSDEWTRFAHTLQEFNNNNVDI